MMRNRRAACSTAAALLAALLLNACASRGGPGFGRVDNYAGSSILGAELPPADARALAPAFLQAVERGGDGERFDWRGPSSFGWVKARERRLGNLKPEGDYPTYPEGLNLDETFETEQGLFALTRTANVRLGPSTDFPAIVQLQSGTAAIGVGKVVGKPWMLIETDGRIAGYVHESLIIKAPGTELDLAGGPRRRATLCRAYEQRLSFGGRSDLWQGVACSENGRWVVKGRQEEAPVRLF